MNLGQEEIKVAKILGIHEGIAIQISMGKTTKVI